MVSVYIIAFYKFEETKRCLDSLRKHVHSEYEVVLVENASSDAAQAKYYQQLGNEWKQFKLIQMTFPRHCPWIRSRILQYCSGDYLFFMDNDCYLEENIFPPLIDLIDRYEDVGGVSPALVYHPSRTLQCLGVTVEIMDDGLFRPTHLHHDDPWEAFRGKEPFLSDLIPGGCSLFKRAFLAQHSYDQRLKNLFGDFDLCLQGKVEGWRYMFHPGYAVIHDKTSNSAEYVAAKNKLTDWMGSVALIEEKWGLRYFLLKHLEEGRVVLEGGQLPRWLPRTQWPENRGNAYG
jgi:GT2 family glycosyltransferase